ncbi:MAG: hypothetical protein V4568_11690 [Pseudomonadota bacterium]
MREIKSTLFNKDHAAVTAELEKYQQKMDKQKGMIIGPIKEWELTDINQCVSQITTDVDKQFEPLLTKLEEDTARYQLQRIAKTLQRQLDELNGLTDVTSLENHTLLTEVKDTIDDVQEHADAKMSSSLESMRDCIATIEGELIGGIESDVRKLCEADEPRKLLIQLKSENELLSGLLSDIDNLPSNLIKGREETYYLRKFIENRQREIAEKYVSLSDENNAEALSQEARKHLRKYVADTSIIRTKEITTKIQWLKDLERTENRDFVNRVLKNNAEILNDQSERLNGLAGGIKESDIQMLNGLRSALTRHEVVVQKMIQELTQSPPEKEILSTIKSQVIDLRDEQNSSIRPNIAMLEWKQELKERKKQFIGASEENIEREFSRLQSCIYSPALIQSSGVSEIIPSEGPREEANSVNKQKARTQEILAERRILIDLLELPVVKEEVKRLFGSDELPTMHNSSEPVTLEPFYQTDKKVLLCRSETENKFIALTRTEALATTSLKGDLFDRACKMADFNKGRKAGEPAQTFKIRSLPDQLNALRTSTRPLGR